MEGGGFNPPRMNDAEKERLLGMVAKKENPEPAPQSVGAAARRPEKPEQKEAKKPRKRIKSLPPTLSPEKRAEEGRIREEFIREAYRPYVEDYHRWLSQDPKNRLLARDLNSFAKANPELFARGQELQIQAMDLPGVDPGWLETVENTVQKEEYLKRVAENRENRLKQQAEGQGAMPVNPHESALGSQSASTKVVTPPAEKPKPPEQSQNQKLHWTADETGRLQGELALALKNAIEKSHVASGKGRVQNPLEDPEVHSVEQRIRKETDVPSQWVEDFKRKVLNEDHWWSQDVKRQVRREGEALRELDDRTLPSIRNVREKQGLHVNSYRDELYQAMREAFNPHPDWDPRRNARVQSLIQEVIRTKAGSKQEIKSFLRQTKKQLRGEYLDKTTSSKIEEALENEEIKRASWQHRLGHEDEPVPQFGKFKPLISAKESARKIAAHQFAAIVGGEDEPETTTPAGEPVVAASGAPETSTVPATPERSPEEIARELEEARRRAEEAARSAAEAEARRAQEEYERVRALEAARKVSGVVAAISAEQRQELEKHSRWITARAYANIWNKVTGNLVGRALGLHREGVSWKHRVAGALAVAGFGIVAPWALGARQAFVSAGVGFATYERLTRGRENKLKLTEAEIENNSPEQNLELMRTLTVTARMKGSWEGLQEAYDRVSGRYQKQLEVATARGMDLEQYLDRAKAEEWQKVSTIYNKEAVRDWGRAAVGAGVGVGTYFGLRLASQVWQSLHVGQRVASWFHYAPSGAPSNTPTLPSGGTPPPIQTPEAAPRISIPESYTVAVQSGEGPIHEARKALALYVADHKGLASLSPAERIWAETELWKQTAREMGKTLRPDLQAEGFSPSTGDTIEFKRPTIERVLASMHERFNDPTKVARLNADYQAYVSRVNWPRYEVVGRHGVWEADQGIKWRPSAPSVTTAVVLDSPPPTATLRELPTFFGPQCDATWPVVTTREILDTEAPQVVTRELTEGALQKVTLELSGMPESYYGVVKGRTVANLLGVSFWDSRETLTPWFPEPEYQGLNQINHRDLTRLTSLRDRVGGILKQMDLGERASASKLTIDQFIKAYMVPKSL